MDSVYQYILLKKYFTNLHTQTGYPPEIEVRLGVGSVGEAPAAEGRQGPHSRGRGRDSDCQERLSVGGVYHHLTKLIQ